MNKHAMFVGSCLVMAAFSIYSCSGSRPEETKPEEVKAVVEKPNFGGYNTQVEWGEHLVTIGGCNDCHTPKKMTPQGPVDDTSLMLSGHPENMPAPAVDRKQMESKGLIVTATFTSWVGPWGVTYSANLTPDETGTGNWTEEQFMYAIRNMTSKGIKGSRPLLPPMAMMPVKQMTDEELKAMFAYLRTIKPVKNHSVQPTPPTIIPKS